MTPQRKSARNRAEGGRPNLRLVPPPAPVKRARRRWKIGRVRKPKYPELKALHEFEESLVFTTMLIDERRGCPPHMSVRALMDRHPGRFNERELWLTLVRLKRSSHLECSGRIFFYSEWWRIPLVRDKAFWRTRDTWTPKT
jgi:hypothetical protein